MQHKGFSFVQVFSQCPTQAGRYIYGLNKPSEYLRMMKGRSINTKGGCETLRGAVGWKDHNRGGP